MKRLDGKVAIITGGGDGLGASISKLFAREGAAVVMTGRRKDVLEKTRHEIEREKGCARAIAGSVTDEAHVNTVVSEAIHAYGKVDILVNNAGIGAFGSLLHETDDATWNSLLDVNVTGIFRFTRAAIPPMLKTGNGSIVNISSIAGTLGLPRAAAYGATKGAMDALTRCIAVDYAKDGIRCNAISPGLIATPMAAPLIQNPEGLAEVMSWYPIARPGTPEEVATLVVYLASDESGWVTGANFAIDGGRMAQ
jgi:NAD(P)-dependent dehydrogenase (short-subunit alcohol dehydrogenase family)